MLNDPISLDAGPGPLLAFLPEPDPDAFAATAVALANTDGGAIVIGLAGSGAYAGPVDGAAVQRALGAAATGCTPPIAFAPPEIVPTPGGPAIAIRVPRASRVHALADGRVLVRAIAGNRVLNGDEIRALLAYRAHGDFEAEAVPGARIADLDPALVADFMLARAQRLGRPWDRTQDLPLIDLGAVTPDHRVTVAGLLLFGREPGRWLPHGGARFVHLVGHGEHAHVALEREIDGPLVRVLDALWQIVQEQMRTPADGAPPLPEYPAAAVREALVNAVCHRDYRLRGERVTVRLSADRLEIVSPGGLPGFMQTAEYLLGHRFSRNPRLGWCLAQWGYGQGTGQGFLNMIASLDGYGYRPPEIVAQPYRVTVRLYHAVEPRSLDGGAGEESALNARQRQALEYVRAHGSITMREYRALCPARPELLQGDLAGLVAGGHLRKVGSRAHTYYIMP